MIRHRFVPLLVMLSALPLTLSAQMIVRPQKPLDSSRVVVRDNYLVLRDTLVAVTASAARLQRDLSRSSAYVLASRSRVLQESCSAALRTVPQIRPGLLNSPLMDSVPAIRRKALLGSLRALESSLTECQRRFAAWSDRSKSKELGDYGVATARRTTDAIHAYEASANDVLEVMGIRVRLMGAGPDPRRAGEPDASQPSARAGSGKP